MSSFHPTGITANRLTAEMIITWDDGHRSVYSFSLLRFACPCEECCGGHNNMGNAPPPEVFYMPAEESSKTRLIQVEAVGNYGITIAWEDGHQFGIYTWEYLRELCPCDDCRSGIYREQAALDHK